jgi:two-component system LytT family response regulator
MSLTHKKPTNIIRLEPLKSPRLTGNASEKNITKKSLWFKDANGWEQIESTHISHCEAHNNYCKVIKRNGDSLLISRTLKYVEDQINNDLFIRIHQSHLINSLCIHRVQGSKSVIMKNGAELPVARSKWNELLTTLGL